MTVRQFLENNESSIGASGASWDSCNALRQLNRVRSAFYDIGDWDGNTAYICMCACACKIYMPWYASNILTAFICSKPITIADGEHFAVVNKSYCGKSLSVTDNNQYEKVPMQNCFGGNLYFRANDSLDAGAVVDIAYINRSNSLVNDSIVLEKPFKDYKTSYDVKEIKALSKTSTNGTILVMDRQKRCLFGLSPYYTGQEYRVYCLDTGCCCPNEKIVLHVKKNFFAYSKLHYTHLIDFPDHALSLGMEAIAARDLRSVEGIAVYEKLFRFAVQFLKKQKEVVTDTTFGAGTNLLNEVSLVEDVMYGRE